MSTSSAESASAPHHFGAFIRQQRLIANRSQQDIVEQLHSAGYPIGQSYLSQIENGARIPPYKGVLAFAHVLGVDSTMLLSLAGLPLPTMAPHQLAADIFFRKRDDPEPSAFDRQLAAIEQYDGVRYLLYPFESYLSRPRLQIERQETEGRVSLPFWEERRVQFEQQLREGILAYHIHSQPNLLRLDPYRGITTFQHQIELLESLLADLDRFPAFHLALAPADLNLAFLLKVAETKATAVIAAYPRDWGYRPSIYMEGLAIEDVQVVAALRDEFLAIWNDEATLSEREAVRMWLQQQCRRLSAGADGTTPSL